MERPTLEDANSENLFKRAYDSYFAKDYIKALEIIEDLRFVQGNDRVCVNALQGQIFKELAKKTENTDVKVAYLLGSVQCVSIAPALSSMAAISLFTLAQQIQSVLYYKKSVRKAKETLYHLSVNVQDPEFTKKEQKAMVSVIKIAESRIAESKTRLVVKNCEQKEDVDTRKSEPDFIKGLMLYWAGLNVEIKRNFMKFTSAEECKNHLDQEHCAKFIPNETKHMPQRISKVWSRKISIGGWEPVDAAAAIELIKNRLEDVKEFAYENGWSKDWPLAADEKRSKLLKEIQLLLVLFWDCKIFTCSIRDWVMGLTVKHFEKFEVSKHTLTDCHLGETPQIICFCECDELNQILEFLKKIKCERDDGTDLVCRVVESFYCATQVKEKLDFDPQFSVLLLDKRLLQCKISRFDDEGTISVFDPNVHYANAHAQGGYILSWLVDNSSEDKIFRFPTPIRMHNLDIWVAVLKAVQLICMTLATKYSEKWNLLDYDAALTAAKNLCIREDVKRRNQQKDQWTSYASLLCDTCEGHLRRDAGKSLNAKLFLCVVQDVFKGASFPTFNFLNCINVIREHKDLSDDIVIKSIDLLKLVVTKKVVLIDSRFLLVERSRINLLNSLTRLSVFDYRSYILRPMKELILDGIVYMENKAKLAVVEADLISEENQEEGMTLPSKKKKNKNNKKNSKSMSSHLDKTVQHEHSANLELDSTSPSLKPVEEDTLTSESGLLEMTSNINNQEETLRPSIEDEGFYSNLLSGLLASLEEVHSMSNDAAEVVIAILEFWQCWKSPQRESLVTRLFTLEEYERMKCSKCRKMPNYPEQRSYGVVIAADSIRDLKCTFGNIKFGDIIKVIRMEDKMLCDIKTRGCGKANFVRHTISSCPPIFTIVLKWEKNETEKEISGTLKAMDWEIDISKLYEGLEPNTNYRLVSMIGCGEEGEYICMAYKKNRWISLRHEALIEEVVGIWKSVVRFCGERRVRPEILFYEAARLDQ
ncbi:unnamed protein product [Arabidopsis thaliana]|uniref:(thale cress) hypothetical protein n=1 Tax=Arabidopsis thaliana TaxID=3702 RepID=A0A7G2E029_ARATH|nr:unnamed protein product [Arabidopsis thaliana]